MPVYNLTVEGTPEFFANGILVHNCSWTGAPNEKSPDRLDALVWALWEFTGYSFAQESEEDGIAYYSGEIRGMNGAAWR